MPIKLSNNIPEQNDILDYANEMIDELEALRAITGRTGEKEKEEKAAPVAEEGTDDTQDVSVQKAHQKKVSTRRAKAELPEKPSDGEGAEGYFNLRLYLPKEYEKKFRLIRAVSDADILGSIRGSVLGLIDGVWAESKDRIESEMKKLFK